MRKLIMICAVMVFAIGAVVSAHAAGTQLILATGGTAGTYYPFGGAMAKIWNSKIKDMNVTAQTTGASAENIRLINKGEVELALVQTDTLDFAWTGSEAFKDKPLKEMAAVAVLYPEVIQLVVAADSAIKTFADLKGKKVGVGAPGSGTEANFRQLMDVYGMKKEDFDMRYLSFSESAEQFKDRHIDAFIATSGVPNPAVMDVSTTQAVRLIDIPTDTSAKLTGKYKFLSEFVVPANTYKGQTDAVKTVAVNAVLIASSKMKESVAYDLTKALFDNQPELAQAHAKGALLDMKTAVKGVSIPFHPGAAKYYKEKGAIK